MMLRDEHKNAMILVSQEPVHPASYLFHNWRTTNHHDFAQVSEFLYLCQEFFVIDSIFADSRIY